MLLLNYRTANIGLVEGPGLQNLHGLRGSIRAASRLLGDQKD